MTKDKTLSEEQRAGIEWLGYKLRKMDRSIKGTMLEDLESKIASFLSEAATMEASAVDEAQANIMLLIQQTSSKLEGGLLHRIQLGR